MTTDAMRRRGTLVLVVGPSGAGKDSLLSYAASELAGEARIVFPRRVITRPRRDDIEAHDSLTLEGFAAAREQGRFALAWEAHGLSYGIPASIIADLEGGRTVAVNVSRAILAEACRLYSPVAVFHVTAPPHLLLERLSARGRETAGDVAARTAREVPYFPQGVEVVTIINASTVEEAGQRFTSALLELVRT